MTTVASIKGARVKSLIDRMHEVDVEFHEATRKQNEWAAKVRDAANKMKRLGDEWRKINGITA